MMMSRSEEARLYPEGSNTTSKVKRIVPQDGWVENASTSANLPTGSCRKATQKDLRAIIKDKQSCLPCKVLGGESHVKSVSSERCGTKQLGDTLSATFAKVRVARSSGRRGIVDCPCDSQTTTAGVERKPCRIARLSCQNRAEVGPSTRSRYPQRCRSSCVPPSGRELENRTSSKSGEPSKQQTQFETMGRLQSIPKQRVLTVTSREAWSSASSSGSKKCYKSLCSPPRRCIGAAHKSKNARPSDKQSQRIPIVQDGSPTQGGDRDPMKEAGKKAVGDSNFMELTIDSGEDQKYRSERNDSHIISSNESRRYFEVKVNFNPRSKQLQRSAPSGQGREANERKASRLPSRPSRLPSRPSRLPSRPSRLPSRPSCLPSRPGCLPSRPSCLPSCGLKPYDRSKHVGYQKLQLKSKESSSVLVPGCDGKLTSSTCQLPSTTTREGCAIDRRIRDVTRLASNTPNWRRQSVKTQDPVNKIFKADLKKPSAFRIIHGTASQGAHTFNKSGTIRHGRLPQPTRGNVKAAADNPGNSVAPKQEANLRVRNSKNMQYSRQRVCQLGKSSIQRQGTSSQLSLQKCNEEWLQASTGTAVHSAMQQKSTLRRTALGIQVINGSNVSKNKIQEDGRDGSTEEQPDESGSLTAVFDATTESWTAELLPNSVPEIATELIGQPNTEMLPKSPQTKRTSSERQLHTETWIGCVQGDLVAATAIGNLERRRCSLETIIQAAGPLSVTTVTIAHRPCETSSSGLDIREEELHDLDEGIATQNGANLQDNSTNDFSSGNPICVSRCRPQRPSSTGLLSTDGLADNTSSPALVCPVEGPRMKGYRLSRSPAVPVLRRSRPGWGTLLRAIRLKDAGLAAEAIIAGDADPNGYITLPASQLPWPLRSPFEDTECHSMPRGYRKVPTTLPKYVRLHPMHLAVAQSSVAVTRTLLHHGACVNALDQWYRNPLHVLLQPPPWGPSTSIKRTLRVLTGVAGRPTEVEAQMAALLCDAGADLERHDITGRTVLDYISEWLHLARQLQAKRDSLQSAVLESTSNSRPSGDNGNEDDDYRHCFGTSEVLSQRFLTRCNSPLARVSVLSLPNEPPSTNQGTPIGSENMDIDIQVVRPVQRSQNARDMAEQQSQFTPPASRAVEMSAVSTSRECINVIQGVPRRLGRSSGSSGNSVRSAVARKGGVQLRRTSITVSELLERIPYGALDEVILYQDRLRLDAMRPLVGAAVASGDPRKFVKIHPRNPGSNSSPLMTTGNLQPNYQFNASLLAKTPPRCDSVLVHSPSTTLQAAVVTCATPLRSPVSGSTLSNGSHVTTTTIQFKTTARTAATMTAFFKSGPTQPDCSPFNFLTKQHRGSVPVYLVSPTQHLMYKGDRNCRESSSKYRYGRNRVSSACQFNPVKNNAAASSSSSTSSSSSSTANPGERISRIITSEVLSVRGNTDDKKNKFPLACRPLVDPELQTFFRLVTAPRYQFHPALTGVWEFLGAKIANHFGSPGTEQTLPE